MVPGSKKELSSLVSYQEGTIVSRTLLNTRTGTVTLFAFDRGESLSEHTAPFDALLHILDGEAEVTIAGEASVVHGGDVITLPAGKTHAISALQRFKMLLTMIRADTIGDDHVHKASENEDR